MSLDASSAQEHRPAGPTDRLFFALYPDERAAQGMAALGHALRDELRLHGKVIAPGQLHLTLHHLGDHVGLPQALVAAACETAARFESPPVAVTLDRVVSFTRRRANRPLVLLGEDLGAVCALRLRLGEALTSMGLGAWVDKRFTPHVTLLYDDQLVPAQAVAPVAWVARELVLVHSLIGRTRHVPLGRWPLKD